MSRKVASAIRIGLTAILASLIGTAVVALSGIPDKIHSWILGAGAVLFAISEIFFRNLVSELNAVFRRGGYSIWQMEHLEQEIPRLRIQVWHLWNFSLGLKAIVGVIAALLQWDAFPQLFREISVYTGYALLFVTFMLSFHAQKNFRRVEKWCDDIASKEVEIREQKRLKAEMTSGTSHDFEADAGLKSYSKPPRKV